MISQPSPFQTAALKAKAFGSRIITLDLDKQRSINTRVSLVQLLQRIHPFCTVKRQKKLVQLHAKILAQLGHEVLLAASQSLQYYKCGFRKSHVLTYFRCCGEDFQKKHESIYTGSAARKSKLASIMKSDPVCNLLVTVYS